MFGTLVHMPFATALGWTLFHSLWEGLIAAAALAIVLCVARSSRVRYAAGCIAMAAMLAAAIGTLVREMPASSGASPLGIPRAVRPLAVSQALAVPSTQVRIAAIVPWLTPFWIAGVMLFYARGAASWAGARRLRKKGVCVAPERWQRRLDELAERLRVSQAAALLESSLAGAPVVIGFVRPVILLPIGMLAGMPAGQVEAILLHELAHIRRRDYLANLVQTAVEGLLFYHPAAWWISNVIRTERENCCDDLVVAASGNAHEYATALSVLAANRLPATGLSASGGALMKRIRRLLYPGEASPSFLAPLFSVAVLAMLTAWAAVAWQATPPAPKESARLSAFEKPETAKYKPRQIAQVQLPRGVPPQTIPAAADPFTRWLNEDVAYIITDAERVAFLRLNTDDEREMFVEQFWLRRDPTPGTTVNEYKEEHYRRIVYARDHFGDSSGLPGWKTDRGRIYISFGPPNEIDAHPEGTVERPPFEDWRYRFIEGIGVDVMMEFVDAARTGQYRMTMDPNRKQ